MGLKRFFAALLVTLALATIVIIIPIICSAESQETTTTKTTISIEEQSSIQNSIKNETSKSKDLQDSTPLDGYDAPNSSSTSVLAIGLVSFAVVSGIVIVIATIKENRKYQEGNE